MTKLRLHWKIWLAAPAAAATAAFGLIAPAQAQASHPSQVAAGTPATSTQPLQKLFGHPSADGKHWLLTDAVAYRQAVNSKQWVNTPSGLAYTGCVYQVPDHGTVRNNVIIAPDGVRQQIKACQYPTLTYPGAKNSPTISQPSTTAPSSEPCFAQPNGTWWADSCSKSSNWVISMGQRQSVPSNPSKSGALIYLWGGLEDTSGDTVLQDVLTWGSHPGVVSNPNIWYVTPWYGHGGTYVHGNSIHVGAGDTIDPGLNAYDCGGGGACSWHLSATDENNGLSTTYSVTSGVAFTSTLGAVMEVVQASGCDEMPANGQDAFRSLSVDGNGGAITPNFGAPQILDNQCSIAITQSSTGGTITWKP
jgi:hypothetical protein